jgi:hypothetical protein
LLSAARVHRSQTLQDGGLAILRYMIRPCDWLVKVYLQDAYLHVQLHPKTRSTWPSTGRARHTNKKPCLSAYDMPHDCSPKS